MPAPQPYRPISWRFRLVVLPLAFILSLSVVAFWAYGMRFAHLVAHIRELTAAHETAAPAEPGVVTVRIMPPRPKDAP